MAARNVVAVPAGWAGIREDVRYYAQLRNVEGLAATVWLALSTPALWALATYRYGRWVYQPKPALLRWPAKLIFWALLFTVTRLTKVGIDPRAEVGGQVFLGGFAETMIGPGVQVGTGSFLTGGNTLGVAGRGAARGSPCLGSSVVLGPGVVVVGPVCLEAGTRVRANCAVTRTPATPEALAEPGHVL